MLFKRFPSFRQLDAKDCGPACLQIISKHYGKYLTLDFLRERCGINKEGTSIHGLCRAAESIGLQTLPVETSYRQLYEEIPLPCIVHWRKKHFIVVYKIKKDKVWVSDPEIGLITYSKKEFVNGWLAHLREAGAWRKGKLIALEPTDEFDRNASGSKQSQAFPLRDYLKEHLRPYKKQVIRLLALMLVLVVLQAAFPIAAQYLVDRGIAAKDFGFIKLLLLGNVLLVVGIGIGNWVRSAINTHIATHFKATLMSNFIIKLLQLPVAFFENKLSGDVFKRITDYERMEHFIQYSAFAIVQAALHLVVFSGILIFYQPMLFGIFTAGTLLYFLLVLYFWNIRKKMDHQYYGLTAVSHSHLAEMIHNIQDIKNNNYEQGKRWKWQKIQNKLTTIGNQLSGVEQREQLGANLINTLRDVGLTFLSANLVIEGKISIGMLVALQLIIGQLKSPIDEIVGFIKSYQRAIISQQRMAEMDRIAPEEMAVEENAPLPGEDRSMRLENIHFAFNAKSGRVLKDVSIVIPQGKITAIVGSSGSGKSTLMKILARLYFPTAGNLYIGDSHADAIPLKDWRSKIGVVTQETQLFKDSVANNIVLGHEQFDADQFSKSVRIANIEADINRLPLRFDTLLGENGAGLSDGQKQRIHLARAVYKNPDYFFLDEATNNLDPKNEKTIMNQLLSEFKNKTVVIATHRLSSIAGADQIIVIDNGSIVESGNHRDLMLRRGHYFHLLNEQITDSNPNA